MDSDQDLVIESTADGSHTLFVPAMNEHYHSVNGARQESEHIFIKTAFDFCTKSHINILEIGFGTGLNVYLTVLSARDQSKHVNYTSLELYPLSQTVTDKLNYADKDSTNDKVLFQKLHSLDWNIKCEVIAYFSLTKIHTDFTKLDWKIDQSYDIIYFDAFAPDKQPDMWNQSVFDYLYANTAPGGILTTYCAKGVVRRMMQQSGYRVERLPGPPGKREMLRAVKL